MTINKWDDLALDYGKQVYSLTSVPEKCDRILNAISPGDHVLIVGCGSMTHLQRRILEARSQVHLTATDLSRRMLEVASANFTHPRLRYLQSDTTSLQLPSGGFDVAISTNSILPETRAAVRAMYSEIYRILRSGGRFVAYLPSYTCSEEIAERYPYYVGYLDPIQSRIVDTTGWQCFHTDETIRSELESAGFPHFSLEKVGIDSESERAQLRDLYGEKGDMFWEYLLNARRPCGIGLRETSPNYRIEIHRGETLRDDPVLVRAIADFYRFIFNNQDGHYLVFPSTREFVAPEEVLHDFQGKYVDTAIMDDLREFPLHSRTREEAMFWHHPRTTLEELRKKFENGATLALLRDRLGAILGMTFGYFASAEAIFEMEGWRNPLHYAGVERSEHCRDITACLQTLSRFVGAGEIAPAQEFFCYNCVAVDPALHGSGVFTPLVVNFLKSLPPSKLDVHVLSEVVPGSRAYRIYAASGMKPVLGVLDSNQDSKAVVRVLAVCYLPELLDGFGVGSSRSEVDEEPSRPLTPPPTPSHS